MVSKKNPFDAEGVTLLGTLFRGIRQFVMLHVSFIFLMISDSKLYALWWPKGSQKEVFGEPFRNDFEVSGESENEAPV